MLWLALLPALAPAGPAPRGKVEPRPAATPASAASAEAGTLDRLVGELHRKLRATLAKERRAELDLVLVLRSGAGTSHALTKAVQQLVLSRLAKLGLRSYRALATDVSGAKLERQARAVGAELLLTLALELADGTLRLRGALAQVGASLWRDLVHPQRGTLSYLHADVRADAEVRAFLGGARRVRRAFGTRSHPCGQGAILALATGDLDGDGRAELVALRERAVEVLATPRTGQLAFTRRAALVLPGKLASVRPRRAVGTLLVADLDGDRKAEIHLRSSALALGAELAFDGKTLTLRRDLPAIYPLLVHRASGATLARWDGKAAAGVDYFRASDVLGADGKPFAGLPAQFYALKGTRMATPAGPRYHAGVVDLAGKLRLLDATLSTELVSLPNLGVAFDLADLDDDGRLEVVVSSGSELGDDDRIAVYRLGRRLKRLRLLWRSARLSGRVTALTHGDLDGDGKLELVAALLDRRGRCRLLQID